MRRHLAVLQEPASSLRRDGSRNDVQPADVHGRFARARALVFVALLGVYAALPWIPVGGHPAVFLDVERREFYLFGASFNAQDLWLTLFLLTGGGVALVLLTALAGRVWCGWACPQTVFLEGLYRRVERWLQGPREERLRRNRGPLTADKLWRKGVTHALYVLLSVSLAHLCASYFLSLPGLFRMVRGSPAAHPEAFAWVLALSALLYADFAWFREQMCLVLCPYGRLQSALTDEHSLVVGYDAARGEPRGKATAQGVGDCVDCLRCVAVCPTGIDIRNGLQIDCIGCTACIDACDEIMDKLERPRGLVRYDSEAGLAGRARRVLRPRVALYTTLLGAAVVVVLLGLRAHRDVEANVLRLPGAPYALEQGVVRDAFEIHLVNKRARAATVLLEPEPAPGATFTVPLARVRLEPLASVHAPLFVAVPREAFRGDFTVRVRVRAEDGDPRDAVVVSAPFLGPGR